MIQGHIQLATEISKINTELAQFAPIQKIQSTPTTFCLRIRLPGKTMFLHIGRGRGVEGVWKTDSAPIAEVRIRDRFNDWLKKNIKGQVLESIELDEKYRIIKLNLLKKDSKTSFYLFYKGRRLYFSQIFMGEEGSVFRSWVGKKEVGNFENSFESIFGELYAGPSPVQDSQNIEVSDHYDSLYKIKSNNRKKKLLTKKIKDIELKIDRISNSAELQGQIPVIDEKEIEQKFKNFGLKLKGKREENIYQFRDRAFKKIKNFKKSKEFLENKKDNLETELKNVKNIKELKKTTLPEWGDPKLAKKRTNVVYFKIGKISGAYGKNAKGNDFLRNSFGNPKDSWFHLEGERSCHLVIKLELKDIEQSVMELIGSVIRDVTKYKGTEVNLVASKLADIRGVSGRSGAVTMKKPYYFKVLYNSEWKEIISVD